MLFSHRAVIVVFYPAIFHMWEYRTVLHITVCVLCMSPSLCLRATYMRKRRLSLPHCIFFALTYFFYCHCCISRVLDYVNRPAARKRILWSCALHSFLPPKTVTHISHTPKYLYPASSLVKLLFSLLTRSLFHPKYIIYTATTSNSYDHPMKVLIAFARNLRRLKFKGGRIFRRLEAKLSSCGSTGADISKDPHTSCASIEKARLDLLGLDYFQQPAEHQALPPAYEECVCTKPPALITPTTNIATYERGEKQISIAPTAPLESARGRSPQVLYRSQLNELARRKISRRPSPARHLVKPKPGFGAVDDLVALRLQRYALSWWGHVAFLRASMLLVLVMTSLFCILGYWHSRLFQS